MDSPIGPLTWSPRTSDWPACTWAITRHAPEFRRVSAPAVAEGRVCSVRCAANWRSTSRATAPSSTCPWWTMWGTPFQRRVLGRTTGDPLRGKRFSYGELARRVGQPTAIPRRGPGQRQETDLHHRAVSSGKSGRVDRLTGYGGGAGTASNACWKLEGKQNDDQVVCSESAPAGRRPGWPR